MATNALDFRRGGRRTSFSAGLAICLGLFLVCPLAVADAPAAKGDTVVATVGDEPITAHEVERLLAKAVGKHKVGSPALPYLRAQLLEEIIARRLVLAYAERGGDGASAADLAAARKDLTRKLATQRRTINEFLQQQGITAEDLQRQLAWNIVWTKYFARYATPARERAWFDAHRQQVDGSELLVSQIFWRVSAGNDPATVATLMHKAAELRGQILAGKLSFAAAAGQFSESPSREQGGRLGWIGRHGPMDETFTRAAFALAKGEIAAPLRSTLGVHLIRCDDVRSGTKSLAEAREEVDQALGRELLDRLAQLQRARTAVRYTGAMPYFKPGTRELQSR
jgi:parvulin-like peptidyl-prolyl isomerase